MNQQTLIQYLKLIEERRRRRMEKILYWKRITAL